jgi:hypothetical protein
MTAAYRSMFGEAQTRNKILMRAFADCCEGVAKGRVGNETYKFASQRHVSNLDLTSEAQHRRKS